MGLRGGARVSANPKAPNRNPRNPSRPNPKPTLTTQRLDSLVSDHVFASSGLTQVRGRGRVRGSGSGRGSGRLRGRVRVRVPLFGPCYP